MILFSAAMHKILFDQVHSTTMSISKDTVPDRLPCDNDDVYYRFGGATLSAMLKARYRKCKMSSSSASAINTSQEITVLQSINTKEKSSMPKYLKYRDNGYMYTPHSSFIPFFRDVDHCVREIVSPNGFQQYTHELE